jgi:hypothetical protein
LYTYPSYIRQRGIDGSTAWQASASPLPFFTRVNRKQKNRGLTTWPPLCTQ